MITMKNLKTYNMKNLVHGGELKVLLSDYFGVVLSTAVTNKHSIATSNKYSLEFFKRKKSFLFRRIEPEKVSTT